MPKLVIDADLPTTQHQAAHNPSKCLHIEIPGAMVDTGFSKLHSGPTVVVMDCLPQPFLAYWNLLFWALLRPL